jgi:nucleotide-binding universal stress UspA family protein
MRILAVLGLPETAAPVLAAATGLASRLGGGVTALYVAGAEAGIPGVEIVTAADEARHAASAADRRTALQAACAAAGVALREESGDTRQVVAAAAGGADLTVLARPPARFYADMREALHGALADAAAAVLLVGDAVPAGIGAHVAVAWKSGAPAERAIAAAMPVLRRAAQVSVLIADEGGAEAALPDDLLDALERSGIGHAVHVFRPAGKLGDALAREAVGIGADMMVMGAFSHGRLHERVFGGATQAVLDAAGLPVLVRH